MSTETVNAPAVLQDLQQVQPTSAHSKESWEIIQRVANAYANSEIVPAAYRGKPANCIVALEMAYRMKADPMMVMQSLYIVHGNPSWSSKFLIGTFNNCGRYTGLKYEWNKERTECRAYTIEIKTGERIDGPLVTMVMAKDEGWSTKAGSKWKTMPELMLMYRAAAFLIRTYAPEISMGLHTVEEVQDIAPSVPPKGTTTVRFSVSQMAQAKTEIENAVTTAEAILERFTNLALDQVEELKSYTFNLAGN